MNMSPDPAALGSDPDRDLKPRRAERVAVEGVAPLHAQNWYNVEARVQNLSACGFMAECLEPVLIGSYVSLDVPGIGPVHAQVRWQLGTRMGGMFLDPISLVHCEWTAVRADDPAAD